LHLVQIVLDHEVVAAIAKGPVVDYYLRLFRRRPSRTSLLLSRVSRRFVQSTVAGDENDDRLSAGDLAMPLEHSRGIVVQVRGGAFYRLLQITRPLPSRRPPAIATVWAKRWSSAMRRPASYVSGATGDRGAYVQELVLR
jgi:hypothetical protein